MKVYQRNSFKQRKSYIQIKHMGCHYNLLKDKYGILFRSYTIFILPHFFLLHSCVIYLIFQ